MLRSALLLLAAGLAAAAPAQESCYARFDGRELVVGNHHIERRWQVQDGLLRAASFRDLDAGVQWLANAAPSPSPIPLTEIPPETRTFHLRTSWGRANPVQAESLTAELVAAGTVTLTWRFQIFPDAAGVRMQLSVEGAGAGDARDNGSAANVTGIETGRQANAEPPLRDALEDLTYAPQHLRLTQVTLWDQTDVHNELAFEDEWLLQTNERGRLSGNLFFLEDVLTANGLIFLKESPLPHARPQKTVADLAFDPPHHRITLLGDGLRGDGDGSRFVVLAYAGGRAGRIEALQRYQRQLRVFDPERDGMFLSNTWGDRSRDARIRDAFMRKEVEAGARLGVDVIQIDDGWQKGRTVNSAQAQAKGGVWEGFWATDPNFWQPDPERFPQGLDPIVRFARDQGIQFGLWFAPDSSREFTNWEKDAARILELYRSGIHYFKIDGVRALTRTAQQNLAQFFSRVLTESRGGVTIDMDVTAQIRPGYFGMIGTGPLFVENRYTDWHRYWPHQTLRNLWKLGQYVDPQRLRVEFLNNARNQEQYAGDPLAPVRYAPDYLFATTMIANPLGWFEISNLPPVYFERVAPLVKKWKAERARMLNNTIIPIGAAPDGVAWTGFLSVSPDRASGYALVFREMNHAGEWSARIPLLTAGAFRATVLGGSGSVAVKDGELRASVPDAPGFVWVKLERRP